MFEMALGHLVGDYLVQNNWMALNKKRNDVIGWTACTIHCILYTLAVCTIMWHWSLSWIAIVFLSHFIIDKTNIIDRYLLLIGGRSLKKFIDNKDNKVYSSYTVISAGFTALCYTIADNTFHLLIMWIGWRFII